MAVLAEARPDLRPIAKRAALHRSHEKTDFRKVKELGWCLSLGCESGAWKIKAVARASRPCRRTAKMAVLRRATLTATAATAKIIERRFVIFSFDAT